jgi:hypothetical protein
MARAIYDLPDVSGTGVSEVDLDIEVFQGFGGGLVHVMDGRIDLVAGWSW